jgi:DNA-binding NtrC family response regulator
MDSQSILVVDDDRDTCANLSDVLTDFGFYVDVADRVEDALQLVGLNHYRLALLDFRMPGLNGVELLGRIRQVQHETEAVIITAFAAEEVIELTKVGGLRRVLSKPVDFDSLIPLIQEIMDDRTNLQKKSADRS